MRPTAALALLCCLLSGCSLLVTADPEAAREHRNRAEELIYAEDYAGGAAELHHALRKAPRDGALYLRLTEIQERLGADRDAAATCAKGRRRLAEEDPKRLELAYRQALLSALKLGEGETAMKLRERLPKGSIRQLDVDAALALTGGRGRDALLLLNRALAQRPTTGTAARILYHAARAYQILGDPENANGALYRAINLTDDLALTEDIDTLWKALKESPPATR